MPEAESNAILKLHPPTLEGGLPALPGHIEAAFRRLLFRYLAREAVHPAVVGDRRDRGRVGGRNRIGLGERGAPNRKGGFVWGLEQQDCAPEQADRR